MGQDNKILTCIELTKNSGRKKLRNNFENKNKSREFFLYLFANF